MHDASHGVFLMYMHTYRYRVLSSGGTGGGGGGGGGGRGGRGGSFYPKLPSFHPKISNCSTNYYEVGPT